MGAGGRGGRQGQGKGERGPPRGPPVPPPEWYEQGPPRSYDRGPRGYDRGPRTYDQRPYDPRMYNQGYDQGYDQRYDPRYNKRYDNRYDPRYDTRGTGYDQHYNQGPQGYDNYVPTRGYNRGPRAYDQRQQQQLQGAQQYDRNQRNNYNSRGQQRQQQNGDNKKDAEKKVYDPNSRGPVTKRTLWTEDGEVVEEQQYEQQPPPTSTVPFVAAADQSQEPTSQPEDMLKSIQGVAENCDNSEVSSSENTDYIQASVADSQSGDVSCSSQQVLSSSSNSSHSGTIVSSAALSSAAAPVAQQTPQGIYTSDQSGENQSTTYAAMPVNGDVMSIGTAQQQYVQIPQHAHVLQQMQNMHISQGGGTTMQMYGYPPPIAQVSETSDSRLAQNIIALVYYPLALIILESRPKFNDHISVHMKSKSAPVISTLLVFRCTILIKVIRGI